MCVCVRTRVDGFKEKHTSTPPTRLHCVCYL